MALPRPYIMVLAEMVDALDENPPKTDARIDEEVEYWRGRERKIEHRSAVQLELSVLLINRAEIIQIMGLKHFRDKQRKMKKQRTGRGHGGSRKKGVSSLNDQLGVEVKE